MLCKSLTLWLHASVRQIQTWSAAWNGALQKAHFGAVMCCAVLCKAFLFFSGMWELEKCKSEFQSFPLGSDYSGWPCPQQSCSHPAWWLSWTPVLPANVHKMAKLAPVAVLDLCYPMPSYAILSYPMLSYDYVVSLSEIPEIPVLVAMSYPESVPVLTYLT